MAANALVNEVVPFQWHKQLAWLGTVPPEWLETCPGTDTTPEMPTTVMHMDSSIIAKHPGSDRNEAVVRFLADLIRRKAMINIMYLEASAKLLAEGPKIFHPSEEQWESMEHVKLHLSVEEVQGPYPAMIVSIPAECRRRLMLKHNVEPARMPRCVFVRFRHEPGQQPYILSLSRFNMTEMFHLIQQQPGNEDLETAIARKVRQNASVDVLPMDERDAKHEFPCSVDIMRAALNLCLMLTHYGCKLSSLPPTKSRRERREQEAQLYKLVRTVEMKQNIVVREHRGGLNPAGLGAGHEVAPHWRKGHWRAYPGKGAARAAGEKVPLLFVRPCLVRRDRMDGDASETEVVYRG